MRLTRQELQTAAAPPPKWSTASRTDSKGADVSISALPPPPPPLPAGASSPFMSSGTVPIQCCKDDLLFCLSLFLSFLGLVILGKSQSKGREEKQSQKCQMAWKVWIVWKRVVLDEEEAGVGML